MRSCSKHILSYCWKSDMFNDIFGTEKRERERNLRFFKQFVHSAQTHDCEIVFPGIGCHLAVCHTATKSCTNVYSTPKPLIDAKRHLLWYLDVVSGWPNDCLSNGHFAPKCPVKPATKWATNAKECFLCFVKFLYSCLFAQSIHTRVPVSIRWCNS